MDERYRHRELPASSRHAPQYDILQPHFKQPPRPVPPRNRYRATQYEDPMYDVVEDDIADGPGSHLDSFDNRLLQQPYPSRQRQTTKCTARLSLAPGPSVFPSNEAVAYSDGARNSNPFRIQNDHHSYPHHNIDDHPSRLVTLPAHLYEPSSDPQIIPSSSPAFKAGQRRTEAIISNGQRGSLVWPFKDDGGHTVEHEDHQYAQPHQQIWPIESEADTVYQESQPLQNNGEYIRHSGYPTPLELQTARVSTSNAPPVCQGIRLVPVATLPDRLRTVFPYPTFNAVQSKCFDTIFRTDNNFVLASPTGSGKTVILELAVCRAFATNATGQYKIVYQAPTKALCSERQHDWEIKFSKVGLKCAELTGDSDSADLKKVQSANIVITTPEKWDSMTRKWKDHERLMRLVRVFLIDEVHILKEDRGATLETIVSRMKSIGTDVRFVALSATVPNFKDIAAWLGKSSSEPDIPAANEDFGEDFRPVRLRKHVCGYVSHTNDFAFENVLDTKITDVITTFSEKKPMLVFCATRKSTAHTAKLLARWWSSRPPKDRFWIAPSRSVPILDKDLRVTVASGVAFHNGGLDTEDRKQVEKCFIAGEIGVICCTSTLAVGVNLPCHLVIIKNTVGWSDNGLQEYSDLEMMQMLGRAGRPQFDSSAVAVIMTRHTKVRRYEMMVSGQEVIESKLHLNLVDHMNAEIGLGTIRDLPSARKWLKGTFLFIRLQQNPGHYKLESARNGQSIDEQIDDICVRDVNLLREYDLISGQERFTSTEFGNAMSQYYVHFETMKLFMGLQAKCTLSEILSAIAQAKEYSKIRFRQGEKQLYRLLNKSPSIRMPIPINLELPAHKVSLIIQSVLGSADIPWEGEIAKHKSQYTNESIMVFKNIGSLIRCIVDCRIELGDAVSIQNALMLERSLGARIWDDSPLQMKQIGGLGVVSVRKLVNAGIKSIEDLEGCDPHRIEALLGRNPPYGLQVLEKTKCYPKLRVSLQVRPGTTTKTAEGVRVQIKADIGFMNERVPQHFNNKLVYVCLFVETSDGRKVHFARMSGLKIGAGQNVTVSALLTSPDQFVNCHVMCDGIAGSMRSATARPQIPRSIYPTPKPSEPSISTPHQSNMSKRRIESTKTTRKLTATSDDFGDDDIDDDTLVKAAYGNLEFDHIDTYPDPFDSMTQKKTVRAKFSAYENKGKVQNATRMGKTKIQCNVQDPVQLANGKWACNHLCKNRDTCKHLCCKEGMDKPRKKSYTTKTVQLDEKRPHLQPKALSPKGKQIQTKLHLTASKRKLTTPIEELDLTQQAKKNKVDCLTAGTKDDIGVYQLHKFVEDKKKPSTVQPVIDTEPAYHNAEEDESCHSFAELLHTESDFDSSDYGDVEFDHQRDFFNSYQDDDIQHDLAHIEPDHDNFVAYKSVASDALPGSETYGDDDSMLGDAMIGLVDSQNLQDEKYETNLRMSKLKEMPSCTYQEAQEKEQHWIDHQVEDIDRKKQGVPVISAYRGHCKAQESTIQRVFSHSNNNASGSRAEYEHLIPAMNTSEDNNTQDPTLPNVNQALHISNKSQEPSMVGNKNTPMAEAAEGSVDMLSSQEKAIPQAFEDLEPWLFREFGDIVELVDE